MNLNVLLKPKSIVIIGASDKLGMGGDATRNVPRSSIGDHVYYINPKRDELYGRKCYNNLEELPEKPDLMILCTPGRTVPSYLEQAGQLGIKAAVVFASGFSEERTEEAHALAEEVRVLCEKYDIALCGPNCVGYMNSLDKICGGPLDYGLLDMDVKRGLGIVAQSGFVTSGFTNPDARNLAYIVSAGNCTAVTLEEYMLFFARDERVNCIAAYIEGIKKPSVLEEALREAALARKPVVVLKAGMTAKGSFAAASHTGSLAGDYKTIEAVFRKYGAIVCKTLQEFVCTAKMFAVLDGNIPKGTGVGAINFSGGENTLCADTCDRFNIELPEFEEKTLDVIRSVTPSFATAANPLDATTQLFAEPKMVRSLFMAVSEDKNVGLITLGNDVGQVSEQKDITCSEVLSDLKKEYDLKPLVVIPSFEKARNDDVRIRFEDAGIPVLSTGELAFTAIRHLLDFASFDPERVSLSLAIPESRTTSRSTVSLSESASKAEIAKYGVKVPAQANIKTLEELRISLKAIPFPVVMKVDSPDILHKTDAGGVKLNITDEEEAVRAFDEIMQNCRAYAPAARIDGIQVQQMVPGGTEFIIGVKNDKQFGPMLLAGMGGVFVEVFRDAALYPCPLNKKEAMDMISGLKCYKLLTGFRGSAPKDIDALAELMVCISDYAVAQKDQLSEMDLNPVFVYDKGNGVCAVDALIVKRND